MEDTITLNPQERTVNPKAVITAILVDDERPALRELEFMLKKYPEIDIRGAYTKPLEALEEIDRKRPKVVFLDINMAPLHGMDAASRILDLSPDTEIIFVTAYDRYAVEAFDLNALDYVLKPIDVGRFDKTIRKILKKFSATVQVGDGYLTEGYGKIAHAGEDTSNGGMSKAEHLRNRMFPGFDSHERRLSIKCFGKLQVAWEGEEPIRWHSGKTRELFAYLIQNRGRDITKDELLENIWPDEDGEKAARYLYNGIYYIRKALENYGVDRSLITIDSRYRLRLGDVGMDVSRLEDLDRERDGGYDKAPGEKKGTVSLEGYERKKDGASLEELYRIERLYSGDYLEDINSLWAVGERERLLELYLKLMLNSAVRLAEEGKRALAEKTLLSCYKKDPYREKTTILLLKLYKETGDKSKARLHFEKYRELLKKDLGIAPHGEVLKVYGELK